MPASSEHVQTPEERILGRSFRDDDPPWLLAFVYAHDAGGEDILADLLTETFGPYTLARALIHAVRSRDAVRT